MVLRNVLVVDEADSGLGQLIAEVGEDPGVLRDKPYDSLP